VEEVEETAQGLDVLKYEHQRVVLLPERNFASLTSEPGATSPLKAYSEWLQPMYSPPRMRAWLLFREKNTVPPAACVFETPAA